MNEKMCKIVGWIALVATSASMYLVMERVSLN